MNIGRLLLAGAVVAAVAYLQKPMLMRVLSMNLDPSAVDPIEDRRGEPPSGPSREPGPPSEDPGDPRGTLCWDTVEQREVPMDFCDSEEGMRRS